MRVDESMSPESMPAEPAAARSSQLHQEVPEESSSATLLCHMTDFQATPTFNGPREGFVFSTGAKVRSPLRLPKGELDEPPLLGPAAPAALSCALTQPRAAAR
eukprot:COSAG04_NODE_16625_length_493_cov_1.296954_1_plen_102_part_01